MGIMADLEITILEFSITCHQITKISSCQNYDLAIYSFSQIKTLQPNGQRIVYGQKNEFNFSSVTDPRTDRQVAI